MVNDIKKIELHLHLDGSVMLDIAKKITNEEDLESKMITTNAKNLKEYLTKFDLPIDIMQTKESLELISRALVNKLEKDNVVYAEIRFCPLFHIKKGLTLDEVIESILKGLESDKVKTNLILCMMRGFNQEDNLKVISMAY